MRFALISARHKRVFDLQLSVQIGHDFICRKLRCDAAFSVELTDDLWLWVPDDPRMSSFRLMADGPEYFGDGFMCGRTRMDECKSLPRHYHYEMIQKWFVFPAPRQEYAIPRRQSRLRPTRFPLPALSIPTTEWRPEARERAYI